MVTTNTASGGNVYAAADAIAAITAVLSEYGDSCWSADGMTVVKRPPSQAVLKCRRMVCKLENVIADLENAEDMPATLDLLELIDAKPF